MVLLILMKMIWIMVNDICDLFKTFFYEVFV